ncbi:MAG: hypothetical protein IJJ13_07965 [Lachnospiraceae bacterium]|nr:hypothetical protein [Lachnospiraceae bacterium]
MIIHFLGKASEFLDRESYDAFNEMNQLIYGTAGSDSDERAALALVKQYLAASMDRLYLEKYDASEKKKRITKLCEKVIDVYREMLSEEEWLSDETKEKAIEKLDAMTIRAVYPEKWTDDSAMDLKGLSCYECMIEIERFIRDLDSSHINGTVDREIWDTQYDILDINAFYDRTGNSIDILLVLFENECHAPAV